ncbi:hypothetical protein D3C80_1446140 [compost metagenome]
MKLRHLAREHQLDITLFTADLGERLDQPYQILAFISTARVKHEGFAQAEARDQRFALFRVQRDGPEYLVGRSRHVDDPVGIQGQQGQRLLPGKLGNR